MTSGATDTRSDVDSAKGGPSRGKYLLPLAAAALIVGLLTAYYGGRLGLVAIPPIANPAGTAATGQPAPDFALTTLDGQRISLASLKGQPVVLNFWASWCVPCRFEMPHFEAIYRAYRDQGVVFIGAAVQDDPESVSAFVQELDITYSVGLDLGHKIATRYQLTSLPTTVFITRDGRVAQRWAGLLNEQKLTSFVEEIAR